LAGIDSLQKRWRKRRRTMRRIRSRKSEGVAVRNAICNSGPENIL
jgi:hypothetical protein